MKILILDYSAPRVAVIKRVPPEITSEQHIVENFLEQNGFHCSNCHYMVTEDDQCNEADILEFRARAEHVGQFDINTQEDYSLDEDEYDEEEL